MRCGEGTTTRLDHTVHWVIVPQFPLRSYSSLPKSSWLDYHKDWYISWGQVISELTFSINDEYRKVSWILFIETITRIASQPLEKEHGFLREALNSLYTLFCTTRNLLKNMTPSPISDGITIELFAVRMLNEELRPFLSKWHPILSAFEKVDPIRPENEWEYSNQFRTELEELRVRINVYAKSFGELANVSNLDSFFHNRELNR